MCWLRGVAVLRGSRLRGNDFDLTEGTDGAVEVGEADAVASEVSPVRNDTINRSTTTHPAPIETDLPIAESFRHL